MKYVYVLDQQGNPLMPTRRYGWVRRALKAGRAKAVTTVPFTIRLAYEPASRVVQDVILGIDPGRTNIGLAAVVDTGRCLYSAHCATRNKEIPKLMEKRLRHRQASRRGERLARKRLAKRLGTTRNAVLERILPGYEKPVKVKDILNTEAKFNNRKRPAGWLTPTARQLLQTHISLVKRVCGILPVSQVVLELNRFAFMELEAGKKLFPEQYRHGPLHGYTGIRQALEEQQGGLCLLCGTNPMEHLHHLVARSRGGSDTLANLAGLCPACHERVHKDASVAKELAERKTGINKKYHALSVLNQIISYLAEELQHRFGREGFIVTRGWNTKKFRDDHKIGKDHDIDAYCIACSVLDGVRILDVPECSFEILQFRRHNRANIHSQRERAYKLNKAKAAVNRRKRTEQKTDSLEDWFEEAVRLYGIRDAEIMRSRLTVTKSRRIYNTPGRLLPGAVFRYQGRPYVLSGNHGPYLNAAACGKRDFPKSNCITLKQNTGIVYMPQRKEESRESGKRADGAA